ALYRWIKSVDPSRPVQYEGGGADTTATDIICPMYARCIAGSNLSILPARCSMKAAEPTPRPPILFAR
ncbi:hypothetical protein CPT11_28220, partial [Klebsiella pneumoniae]